MKFNIAVQNDSRNESQVDNIFIEDIRRGNKVKIYDIIDVEDHNIMEFLWGYPFGIGFTVVICEGSIKEYRYCKKEFSNKIKRFNGIKTLVV